MTRAQNTVEYGLIIALVALAVLIGAWAFGPLILHWLQDLVARVTATGAP